MVLSRLKQTRFWNRFGENRAVTRTLQQVNGLVHHTLGSHDGTGSGERFVDSCGEHVGSAAAPAYEGVPSPLSATPGGDGFNNPVLTAGDVTDYGNVTYVADPFLLLSPENWQLYFEVYNADRDPSAVIGRATSSDGGSTWKYDGVVLDPGVHASFPYVIRWRDTVWMTPNLDPERSVGEIPLYRSDDGGATFQQEATLATPTASPTDRVVFRYGERWWLLVSIAATERELHVYHSDTLAAGNWTAHTENPVLVDEPRIPGGRPVIRDDQLLMFFQNGDHYYGERIEPVAITELTTTTYADRQLSRTPVVGPTASSVGWNSSRMHTFDPWYTGDRWVCAVDGDTDLGSSIVGPHWSIGLYSIPARR